MFTSLSLQHNLCLIRWRGGAVASIQMSARQLTNAVFSPLLLRVVLAGAKLWLHEPRVEGLGIGGDPKILLRAGLGRVFRCAAEALLSCY